MDYKIFVADGFEGKKYKKVRNFRWEKKGIDKVKKNQPMLNSNILAN